MELNYHSLMQRLFGAIRDGALGRVEFEGAFCGRCDRPLQFLVRDCVTLAVELGELHQDGTIYFRETWFHCNRSFPATALKS